MISLRKCFILLALVVGFSLSSSLQANEASKPVIMEVFWGTTCGYCRRQKPFLAELEKNYPQLKIRHYEIYENVMNRGIFSRTAQAHGVQANSVPAVFIAGKHFPGDSTDIRAAIEAAVRAAIEETPAVATATESQ